MKEDEDICYGITVEKKQYEASYYQLPEKVDSIYSTENRVRLLLDPTEEFRKDIVTLSIPTEKYANKLVWFAILEGYREYKIGIFYENSDNRADGEEL